MPPAKPTRLAQLITPLWQASRLSAYPKIRRLRFIDTLLGNTLLGNRNIRVLDVGCNTGKDFIQLVRHEQRMQITGVDMAEYDIARQNVTFVRSSADNLPFDNGFFDIALSIGTFEHITPIESLSLAIKEIARVSRSYCVVIPAVSSLLEPHVFRVRYPLRLNAGRANRHPILYMNDVAWLSFEGFQGAHIVEHCYLPLIRHAYIYKRG